MQNASCEKLSWVEDPEKISYLIKLDLEEKGLLIKHGYYSKVKHVLDELEKEPGFYLVQSEIFSNIIGLYYVKSNNINDIQVRWVLI